MKSIEIFLRIKGFEDLQEISLASVQIDKKARSPLSDILWESTGEYFLEAFQCGTNPSICSIEKDPRILNEKEEIALMILDEMNKEHYLQMTEN